MRTLSAPMLAAQNNESFKFLTKLEVFPTRIFFEFLDDDFPIAGADAEGVVGTPMKQEIAYNETAGGLVTFFCDGDLKYAVQGDDTVTSTGISSLVKPGVFGDRLFVYVGTTIKRYSINWSGISLSEEASMTPSVTPVAIHAISETECIAVCNDDGGFRILYIDGTTEIASTSRFMFPSFIDIGERRARNMSALGLFSGAAKLNGMPFSYISNAVTGMVQGIYYDPETETWSDIFTTLPTDLKVSLCEFRTANVFVRNNVLYMAGQFNRTDIYGTAKVYSLILRSEDGKTFSIDNFTLVSDLNYRFLATIGTNATASGTEARLYIGNCNRVASKPLTWYFDGDDHSTSLILPLSEDDYHSVADTDANQLSVSVRAGDESLLDNYLQQFALVKYYNGFETSSGPEYTLWGTYLIDAAPVGFANGRRTFSFSATAVSLHRLTGLTMPFYAEIAGISASYDPMNAATGKLYAAPNMSKSQTMFQVDFFEHRGYSNPSAGITAMSTAGGPPEFSMTGAHKLGIITKREISELLRLTKNPKVTETSFNVQVHGWSRPDAVGTPGDTVYVVVVLCDENGDNEETIITNVGKWKVTYPYTATGEEPIAQTITGLTVDKYVKYLGLAFESTGSSMVVPARIEVMNNVEVPMSDTTGDVPWTLQEDGTFKLPGAGHPFIMFAQRPYNTQNFVLAASFTSSVIGEITGYPVGVGLVGLAQDASNCIVARYNQTNNKVELVKIRSGFETILADATPSWTPNEVISLQFKHRDGHFEVYLFRGSAFGGGRARYELIVSYDWADADGFMFTSSVASIKCGLYGIISAPSVRTLSFYKNTTGAISGDGIPVDPLFSIGDFPSSGRLRMGETVYTYEEKITQALQPRGPYQVRNVGVYGNDLGGGGQGGMEVRDFDWNGSGNVTTGKLIAVDNGLSFVSTGETWRVYTLDRRTRRYLYNRARYYSNNLGIRENTRFSANNRVWIVGGFKGIGLYSGEPLRHPVGEWVTYELEGEIKCHWFMGSGGETDTTIEDLVERVCALSGTKANFPGDFSLASLEIGTVETTLYQDDYAESMDLSFETAAPIEYLELRANLKLKPDNYEEKDEIIDDTSIAIGLQERSAGNNTVLVKSNPSETVMFELDYTAATGPQKYRFLFYGKNISLYQNHQWVTTVVLDGLDYHQDTFLEIKAYATETSTLENIRVKDLGDWREAVYIDLQTDGNSALGSIIQERPVENVTEPDGSLSFFYERVRSEITMTVPVQEHDYLEQDPREAASDGIIYGAGEVQTIQYRPFAKSKGLATTLIRVPNLDVGALEAGYRLMDRMYESRGRHKIVMRPDLRVQVGDILHFFYQPKGTNILREYSMIVENVSHSITMGDTRQVTMTLSGRNIIP